MLRELGVKGPAAIITAGFQEREGEAGLVADAGVPVVDLELHKRGDEVLNGDTDLAKSYKQRQIKLKLMQDFYRVRLDHAEASMRAIQVRSAPPDLMTEEFAASLELVRHIDRDHLARCRTVHAEFESTIRPRERFALSRHLAELRALIAPTDALVIAGGHVAVLLNRLRLFDILHLVGDRPIVTWSAGAMTMSERVVLFHDDPPHGKAISEILDAGFSIARDVVLLPGARSRLRLDDKERVAELAHRYTPATCVTLDRGAKVWIEDRRIVRAENTQRLTIDGTLEAWP